MTNLVINDLEQNLELDRKALSTIRGAWGIGSFLGGVAKKAVRVTTGAYGAAVGASAGAIYGGLRGGVPGFFRTGYRWGVGGFKFGYS